MVNVAQATTIAGLGAVTGYGWGLDVLWQGLLSGRSAGGPVVLEEINGLAAVVPEGGDEQDSATLFGRALYGSGREAVADAKARGWNPGARVGMILCSSLGEVQGWRELYFERGGRVSRRHYLQLLPSTAPSMFMAEQGFHGPSLNAGAACASGVVGIILARQWLISGFATDVVVSGTDLSVTPENARHFKALNAIATDGPPEQACRPFQEGSQGFLPGEASVALVLTRQEGVDAYAHVLGGGLTHDAFHPIAIHPDGLHVAEAWTQAIAEADVALDDIAYLNAHGTGTQLNDTVEAGIADAMLPERTRIYTTKMLTGHGLGAGGAVETLVAALTYETDEIPAAPLVAPAHHRVLDGVTPRVPGATLKSSIGMGGYNAAIVIDKLGG
ncbi:MAG: 3-oxoacyl-ACP synthase [Acidimicrobiales bacterium]|nr:3-oxoacyl-ACP synthase [Acidimicrobiales bacterium]